MRLLECKADVFATMPRALQVCMCLIIVILLCDNNVDAMRACVGIHTLTESDAMCILYYT